MTANDPAQGLAYSSSRGRWVIAVAVLGSGMAALDGTTIASGAT
jgi:hypothetical protein